MITYTPLPFPRIQMLDEGGQLQFLAVVEIVDFQRQTQIVQQFIIRFVLEGYIDATVLLLQYFCIIPHDIILIVANFERTFQLQQRNEKFDYRWRLLPIGLTNLCVSRVVEQQFELFVCANVIVVESNQTPQIQQEFDVRIVFVHDHIYVRVQIGHQFDVAHNVEGMWYSCYSQSQVFGFIVDQLACLIESKRK